MFTELREAFGIPSDTYYKWKERLSNGYYDIRIKWERKRNIDEVGLTEAIKKKPDTYLKELAKQFDCTTTAVFYALKNSI